MGFPTPKGFDKSQFDTKLEPEPKPKQAPEPEPQPTSEDHLSFPDDMTRTELHEAIQTYQEWCNDHYDVLNVNLDEVPVELSDQMKRTAGKVIHVKGSDKVKCIRYALKAYETWGWKQFAETIRHELIHVHTVQNYQKGGHGRLFKTLVEPLETHRHCETFSENEAKYVLYCTECDKDVAYRYKKSKIVKQPSRYQSGCCNASLRVETN